MTTTDSNGIVFVETTDPISPIQVLLNGLQTGTSNAINGVPLSMTSAARTAIVSPVAGKWIYETDTKAFAVHDGSAWRFYDTAWQTYTPTLFTGSTPATLGNGVASAKFFRTGRQIRVQGSYTLGSTSSLNGGSGATSVGLPSGYAMTAPGLTAKQAIGNFRATVGAVIHGLTVASSSLSVTSVYFIMSASNVGITVDDYITNAQYAASGHVLSFAFQYEAV